MSDERMSGDVLLVGRLPFEEAEDAFRAAAQDAAEL